MGWEWQRGLWFLSRDAIVAEHGSLIESTSSTSRVGIFLPCQFIYSSNRICLPSLAVGVWGQRDGERGGSGLPLSPLPLLHPCESLLQPQVTFWCKIGIGIRSKRRILTNELQMGSEISDVSNPDRLRLQRGWTGGGEGALKAAMG